MTSADGNYHDIHDRMTKKIGYKWGQGILNFSGLNYTFKGFLPTEHLNEILKRHLLDLVIETYECVVVFIEFQHKFPTKEKLKTINVYNSILFQRYGKPIIPVIFCLNYSDDQLELLDMGLNEFHYIMINVVDKEISKKLNIIEDKLENNIELSEEDMVTLLLAPYGARNPEEFKEIFRKATILDCKLQDTEDRDLCKYFHYLLANRLIVDDNKFLKEIVNMVKKDNIMYQDVLPKNEGEAYAEGYGHGEMNGEEKGIKKGIKKGEEKATKKLAKAMLDEGMSLDKVSSLTGLSQSFLLLL